jgi:hypothetical protein
MSRGARAAAHLLAGAPVNSINHPDVDWLLLPCSALRAHTADGS